MASSILPSHILSRRLSLQCQASPALPWPAQGKHDAIKPWADMQLISYSRVTGSLALLASAASSMVDSMLTVSVEVKAFHQL